MDVIEGQPTRSSTDLQESISGKKPHLSVLSKSSRASHCVMCGKKDNCQRVDELRAADIVKAIDLVEKTGFVKKGTISAMRSEVERHCPQGINFKSAALDGEIETLAGQLVSSTRIQKSLDLSR